MKIELYMEADIPLLLWGAPGTGKSAAISYIAEKEGHHIETLILSQLLEQDLLGLPIQNNGEVVFAPPAWAKRLAHFAGLYREKKGRYPILFLDELSCANRALQAAALRVIQERKLGDLDLKGCRIIAAANPSDSAAGEGVLALPTTNRFAHLDWVPNLQEWITGELSGWGKKLPVSQIQSTAKVCEFLRKNVKLFLQQPANNADETQLRAWPSPRSWSAVSKLLSVGAMPAEISSVVGAPAAREFGTWMLTQDDLPDPASILYGKEHWPKNPAVFETALSSVCALALSEGKEAVTLAWNRLEELRLDQARRGGHLLFHGCPDILPAFGRKIIKKIDEACVKLA